MMGHRLLMAASNLGLTYVETVLQDKPVAFWQLNETSGTEAADSSGNGNNASISGNVTLGQAGIPAGGGSFAFNDGTLTAANNYIYGDQAVTVEAWVKGSNTENMAFFDAGGTGSQGVSFQLGVTAATNGVGNNPPASGIGPYFTQYSEDGWLPGTGPNVFDGGWHYIAVVRNGLEIQLFVDGEQPQGITNASPSSWTALESQPFTTFATPDTTKNPILIGNSREAIWTGLAYWIGNLSNVAIYNTALSAARILAHYNAGIS